MYGNHERVACEVTAPTDEAIRQERQRQMDAIRQLRHDLGKWGKATQGVYKPVPREGLKSN